MAIEFNNKNLDLLFFYYFINSNFAQNFLLRVAKGSTIKNLSKKEVDDLICFYPKLNEQKIISQILDLTFKELDKAKVILEKEQKRFDWMSDALLSGEYQIVD